MFEAFGQSMKANIQEIVMKNNHHLAGAIIVGLGIAIAGFFVGDGFFKGRATDRYVTVKGISERDVAADLALWPNAQLCCASGWATQRAGHHVRAISADIEATA